jgi:lincosamide nucleotidyltransferase A/C/D/E
MSTEKVDPTALLVAVLTVATAPLIAIGPWDRMNTVIAIVVLLILIPYTLSSAPRRVLIESGPRLPVSAAIGLVSGVAFAWPIQNWIADRPLFNTNADCISDAVAKLASYRSLFLGLLIMVILYSLLTIMARRKQNAASSTTSPATGSQADQAPAMVDTDDVLMVLDRLDRDGLGVWLDGGWGVDALLGRHSRPHRDLDLVIARDDFAAARDALAGLGFRHDPAAMPGLPARLVLVGAGGRQIDLHPVVFDAHGNGWQELGDGAWGAYPAEGLTGVGTVGGRQVRCLTPELQVRHHLGYPLGATDRHDLALLAERFGVAVPPVGLADGRDGG